MPNNSKTTWQCQGCKTNPKTNLKQASLTTSTSSTTSASPASPSATALIVSSDSSSDSDEEISVIKETTGSVNKFGALATLGDSDYKIITDSFGWLTCDIIQSAQVLLKEMNPLLEGLQRPTL